MAIRAPIPIEDIIEKHLSSESPPHFRVALHSGHRADMQERPSRAKM
jgi:hypothetical protein